MTSIIFLLWDSVQKCYLYPHLEKLIEQLVVEQFRYYFLGFSRISEKRYSYLYWAFHNSRKTLQFGLSGGVFYNVRK